MTTIEFLPHVADIRLRVEADSLQEIFHAALKGMNQLLKNNFCESNPELTMKEKIQIESPDATCLLVDFLSEALALSHINNAVYCGLEVKDVSEKKLDALIWGSAVTEFDDDIKAVTYHEANLRRNDNNRWETKIIFDI